MKKREKNYCFFLIVIGILSILVIIGISFYNQYLSRTYLKGKELNFVSALKIVNDAWYFFWFFLGLANIFALVASPCVILIKEEKYNKKALLPIVGGFIINIMMLITLLIVYSNPILLAFSFVVIIGGAFMFISYGN